MNEIKSIIDNTLKKMGLKSRALEYKVMELWEDVVGNTITKHTSVYELHRGVLFVHVDHPVWIQHLSFVALDIKNKLNKAVGAKVVKEIRFKAGNRCNKQKTYQDMDGKVEPLIVNLSKEEIKTIKAMVEEIVDPGIRKTAESLISQGKRNNLCKQKLGWKACPRCGVLIDPKERSCFHCHLQEKQLLRRKTRSILWELPWLSFSQTSSHIPDLDQETYDIVRREMIQGLWERFRSASKSITFVKIPKSYIQTYVMMRTGFTPEKLTNEIIWETLGENMAIKLLGGQ